MKYKFKKKFLSNYVTMLPTDLSSLIALYGDNSKKEDKLSYLYLLNQTLYDCGQVFGDYQPYYLNDYDLPTQQSIKNGTDESKIEQLKQPANIDIYFKDDEYQN